MYRIKQDLVLLLALEIALKAVQHPCIKKWMINGWIDKWMNESMDEWMDRWMDQ